MVDMLKNKTHELISYYFSDDVWIAIQHHLKVADIIMRKLAKRYNMRFRSNPHFFDGGKWPARILRKRKWHKLYEIEISLNAEYLVDKKLFYELRTTCMIFLFFWGKTLWHKKIKEYSIEQMNDQELLTKDVLDLIENIQQP